MKEEGYNYEEFHAKALEICKGYGLIHDERLDEWLYWIGNEVTIDLNEEMDAKQQISNFYQLSNILQNGERVIIQAAMPDFDGRERHIELKMTPAFQRELVKRLLEKTDVEDVSESLFESRYDLLWLKLLKGRGKNIPHAGAIVATMIHSSGSAHFNIKYKRPKPNKTHCYCLFGDLLILLCASPIPENEWKALNNKEKADAVKSWIKSFIKAAKEYYSDYYSEKSKEPHKDSKVVPFEKILPIEDFMDFMDNIQYCCGL